jgi:Carboxypeptidase regulatory-like domain
MSAREIHSLKSSSQLSGNQRSKIVLLLLQFVSFCLPAMSQVTKLNIEDQHSDSANPSAELAQTDAGSTAVVIGIVLDPSGAAISGAQVRLTIADGTTVQTSATDAAGTFRLVKVAPGNYSIHTEASGFQQKDLAVAVGEKAISPLRINLSISSQSQTVTVGGQDLSMRVTTDVAENRNANTIDRDALDRVPVFDQDYINTLSRFLDDSAVGTNGVTLVVNGLEANGPGVTASAVQEVRINQNPYSALFSRPGRARLEIVTKGGTPDFHGTVNFLFRDSVFDARNTFADQKPQEQRQFYEGSLTGPLGRNKRNTFLLSVDQDLDDARAFVNAETLQGPIRENVPAPIRHFFGSTRAFHDFVGGDQFWIGYSYEHQSFDNQNVGGTTLPEAAYSTMSFEHEINVSYRHLFSPKWVNQLRFLVGYNDQRTASANAASQIVVSGAFTGGGAQADFNRTEGHFDGANITTYSSGKHTVNFSVESPDISRRGFDDSTNSLGTYIFGSLADFDLGVPSAFVVQQGQPRATFLEKVFGASIQDDFRWKPNFSISVGLRYYWQNFFHDDSNNFAPRFGFAYAPTKKSKIVVRGGAGVFFDRTGPRPISDLLHYDGETLLRFIPVSPIYPETPASLADVPTSVVVLDPHLRIPYTIQYSIGVERQMTAKTTLSATYVRSHGIDLFRSIDSNAPLPGTVLRPDSNLGQERQIQSDGYQKSNALELTFRGKLSGFFNGQVQYTLSKTYNNTSGITYFPGNSFDPSADWARSDNDRRHKFDLLGSMHPIKYFNVGAALSLYAGKPVNVTTGSDDNHDGIVTDRPDGFSRNTLHGPGFINLDLNVSHDFVLSKKRKEARTLAVTLNSFNVLNHQNDVTFVGVITSPFFGRPVAALPPRRMQVNLEYKF